MSRFLRFLPQAQQSGCAKIFLLASLAACGCSQKSTADKPVPTTPLAVTSRPRPPVDPRGVAFVDVAREQGIKFAWPVRPRPLKTNETFGSGCAAFDADDDGLQDVLLVAEPHPVLYQNVGHGFVDVTRRSGLDAQRGAWYGCAIGDYDGDGGLDVLLTGLDALALYRNAGDFRFELVTEQAGLDPANHHHWGSSAGFMDLDGDAWLDLVVLNFVDFGPHVKQYCEMVPGERSACHPREYEPELGEMFRNNGRGGFELVPQSQGMDSTGGVSLVLAFIDLDQDRKMDFYVGNDGVLAALLHNQGDLRFENIGVLAGISADERGATVAAMGADWADFDRDGDLDLAVSNFQHMGAVLFENRGEQYFANAEVPTGLTAQTRSRLGFGTKWLDFENDGWADLTIANGHVYHNSQMIEGQGAGFHQPLNLLRNERGKRFVDITPALDPSVQRTMLGRGTATADFDNDGLMDLLVVDYEGAAVLLENRTKTKSHWVKLDLRSAAPNVFAYGASVTARSGDAVWTAVLSPATSYLSSSDPRIHWGLGDCQRLEELVIGWPSGRTQRLTDVEVDQIIRITEDAAAGAP